MGCNGGRELTFLKWSVVLAAPLNPTVRQLEFDVIRQRSCRGEGPDLALSERRLEPGVCFRAILCDSVATLTSAGILKPRKNTEEFGLPRWRIEYPLVLL